MLTALDFYRLVKAGVLRYERSFAHPEAIFVVKGGPSDIEIHAPFMPSLLAPARRPEHVERDWYDLRDRRIARVLEIYAAEGRLNAHTTLWLHARLNDLASRRSAG